VKLLQDELWSSNSDHEIAKRCVVTHQFVSKLRSSLSIVDSEKASTTGSEPAAATAPAPTERTYTTKHGTVAGGTGHAAIEAHPRQRLNDIEECPGPVHRT
jgi:hypothetical protein